MAQYLAVAWKAARRKAVLASALGWVLGGGVMACGGESTQDTALKSSPPKDSADVELNPGTPGVVPLGSSCFDTDLGALLTAEEIGTDCRLVSMAAWVVEAFCPKNPESSRVLVWLQSGYPIHIQQYPVQLPRPSLALQAAASGGALFCDSIDCRLVVLRDGKLEFLDIPPAPSGPWTEVYLDERPWVRGAVAVAGFDGDHWTTSNLEDRREPVSRCFSDRVALAAPESSILGLTADRRVLRSHGDGTCCEGNTQYPQAFAVSFYSMGEMPSTWVLTPTTLFGNFCTGHD